MKLVRLIVAIAMTCSVSLPILARSDGSGFAGVEFSTSPQLSRPEIEKFLGLRPGATLESAAKALDRLRLKLDEKHLRTNIELVPGQRGDFFIAVDVVEAGLSDKLPTRALKFPRRIHLPNEKPYTLLAQIKERQAKLQDEGRPTEESYENGMKVFSDPACMRLAEEEVNEVRAVVPYLLQVIASDPNPERRADAIELLNWSPNFVRHSFDLIPAIDDSDVKVRTAATKYIWARLPQLPDNFPFQDLVEALSRQLSRPSYSDRSKAMACMIALAKRDSDTIHGIKAFAEQKLQEISDTTVMPNMQSMSKQLLTACANPPPIKKRPTKPSDIGSGF